LESQGSFAPLTPNTNVCRKGLRKEVSMDISPSYLATGLTVLGALYGAFWLVVLAAALSYRVRDRLRARRSRVTSQ